MKDILKDRDDRWLKNATLPGFTHMSYASYKEMIEAVASKEIEEVPENKEGLAAWMANIGGYAGTPNYANSTVGCNDALNPYWSFNEDDDVPLPIDAEIKGTSLGGMGLVYKEMYQQYQQILWVTFGTPKFNTTLNFKSNSVNSSLASIMNKGDNSGIWLTVANLLEDGFILALELPFLPLLGAAALFNKLIGFGNRNISSYYTVKNAMPLYYRMVNTLLSQIAVAMGLYSVTGSEISKAVANKYRGSVPEVLKNGPDIYAIKNRRAKYLIKNNNPQDWDSERLYKESMSKTPDTGIFDSITGAIGGFCDFITDTVGEIVEVASSDAQGSSQYLGFRIEKSTSSSETISNSVGESGYASQLNAQAAEGFSKMFDDMKLVDRDSMIGQGIEAAKGFARKLSDRYDVTGQAAVRLGGAYYDIPETWKNSSFSRSYSVRMKLESRLGDPVSIFQSIYVPLACWMVAALPRQVGKKSYTSPFVIQAFSKGMIATPLCMVTSLSITRGDSEFGWTIDNLPRSIDLNINLQDLNPSMYVGLADSSFMEILEHNDTMSNYISTLTGMSLADFDYLKRRTFRAIDDIALIQKNTTLSPRYWGTKLGNTGIMRALFATHKGMLEGS